MDKKALDRNARAARRATARDFAERIAGLSSREVMELRTHLNVEGARLRERLSEITVQLGLITAEMKRRNQPGPTVDVSEHAVVQYLERILGVDTRAVRRKIREAIPPEAKRGDKFTVDGITYVVAPNGRVTTVYHENPDDTPYAP